MKKILALLSIVALCLSCKKEKCPIVPETPKYPQLILSRDTSVKDQVVRPTANTVIIGQFFLRTDNMPYFILKHVTLTPNGSFTGLGTPRIVIRAVNGSFADSSTILDRGILEKQITIPGNGVYQVQFPVGIPRVARGTIQLTAEIIYFVGSTQYSTGAIGHVTTFR